MVFSVSIDDRGGITPEQRDRLTRLADEVVTVDGERGRYRPVVVGDGLLVTVNAESEADAQRVVAAVLERKATELTATARDWVRPPAATNGMNGRTPTSGALPAPQRSGMGVPNDRATAVGAIIRRRREARGISLRGFARQCDLSPAHVSKIERGHASPSLETLTRIVNELELHDADLFGWPVRRDRRAHVVRAADAPFVPGDNGGEFRVAAQTPSATVVLGSGGPGGFPEPTISPFQVIAAVLAGSVEMCVGEDLIELQAGDTLTVPSLIAHSIRVTGGPDTRTAYIICGERQPGRSA